MPKRFSYSVQFKRKVAKVAEKIGNRHAGRKFDVNEANIRLWRKEIETLRKAKSSSRAPGRGRKAELPDVEKELTSIVHERRQAGCAINTVELRIQALKIAKRLYPDIPFKASAKWCYRFMKRNDISVRKRTSIAQRLPEDYETKLIEFQRYVIKMRKRRRYKIGDIANADQTPLTFDLPSTQTLDFKGADSVTIKSTGNEKNRFTVMLGAYGDGRKMPPYVIFKRKTMPKVTWPKGVIVRCHPKGWMDEALTKDWVSSVWCRGASTTRRMLVLDAFRCHRMPSIKKILDQDRTDLVIIPGGMTSQLQVMDVICNKPFKDQMRQRWNAWMASGEHAFTPSGNRKKVDLVTITQWIKESWEAVDPSIIVKGFKKCCLTNAMDGTEDDCLWQDEDGRDTNDEDEDEEMDTVVNEGLYNDDAAAADDDDVRGDLMDDEDVRKLLEESDSDDSFHGF